MPYVYSTMTSDVRYNKYDNNPNLPAAVKTIVIKGGTGVASKNLITPQGVVTHVTDEDLEILKQDEVFITHQQNKFITVREKEANVTSVVESELELRDASSPLVPEDFSEGADVSPSKVTGNKGKVKPLE